MGDTQENTMGELIRQDRRSGRIAKTTVEACRSIDIRLWARAGRLQQTHAKPANASITVCG